jgi:nitrogen fixation protein NifU and related proteins
MNLYGEVILDHFRHPRNYGSLESPDIRCEDVNPMCGDRIRIELAVSDAGTVREARFQGDLCMIGKAAGSILTEMVTGSALQAIEEIDDSRLLTALQAEIRPARLRCALLPLAALRAGVSAYRDSRMAPG